MLFSDLYNIMVKIVTFVGFRGGAIAPIPLGPSLEKSPRRRAGHAEAGACRLQDKLVYMSRERKDKKTFIKRRKAPRGDSVKGFVLRVILFWSVLFGSKTTLFNPCNHAEKTFFGRLRSLWESFVFRVVCELKTQSLGKFWPK